ncbi:hypothetical protein EDB19DRAFT_616516 [Suillus lakei]|nr:hypothetical protein EDB19DRAFT_616516 [Suillus lakei]
MGFGKVIAIRFKRFTKKGHIQHNSTTTAHPVPATSEPGLEASANVSFATSSEGVSLVRKAYDMAQVALPLVQAVAGAIPLVGAPMQAAIGGLLIGLQAIDRHSQNKSDLDSLTLRLNRLCLDLCNAPQAWDPVEQLRRDSFVRMLKDTSARVTTLHERCFASTSVTQAIAGCFIEIDRYLAEYLWLSQIQSQRDTHEVLVILRREQEDRQKFLTTIESIVMRGQSSVGPSASHLGGTVALGCITLVDATGHHHAISVNCCTSFQQLNDMLRVLFQRDVIEAQIQRWYIETGQYDLCIDEGTQVTPLTSCGWSSIEPGTKIVMRVIIEQQEPSSSEVDYQCHFCGAVNHLGAQAACSINCRVCNRRFQISCEPASEQRSTRSSNTDSNHMTDAEFHLIRNFHVQQTDVCDLVF